MLIEGIRCDLTHSSSLRLYTLFLLLKLCHCFSSMISVLESRHRVEFFSETLPPLVNICKAFPPLCEDVTSLLIQIGRVCVAHLSATSNLPHSGKYISDITMFFLAIVIEKKQ